MVIVVVDVGIILGIIIIVIVGVLIANKGRGNPNSCACTQTNPSTALKQDETTSLLIWKIEDITSYLGSKWPPRWLKPQAPLCV